MGKVIDFFKPAVGALVIILLLKVTGLLGSVSYVAQSALLMTGIRNAETEPDNNTPARDFNYDFSVRTLTGETVNFGQFRNKVVFLNLWATWCGPCRAEMAGIQELHNSVSSDSVTFVMLSLDKSEHRQKVVDFIKKNNYTFPAYTPVGYLPEQLQVPSIPTTLIISKKGEIVSTEVGATNFNTKRFKKFLAKLAAE